jgi:hypothetical protein
MRSPDRSRETAEPSYFSVRSMADWPIPETCRVKTLTSGDPQPPAERCCSHSEQRSEYLWLYVNPDHVNDAQN